MKDLLKRIVPFPLLNAYRKTKKGFRRIPPDEQVFFDAQTVSDGHFRVTYRGVSAIRCPFDYVLYQMILSEVKPDLVIEIGTNRGGGALYLADLMELYDHGVVHTLDIEDKTGSLVKSHPRIKRYLGGWEGYDFREAAGFNHILVIEDASHTYEDTLGAMRKFAPLVSPGSYLIVEDGIVTELGRDKGFNGGPLRAIREFLAEYRSFSVDRSLCDMFGKNATFNVNGYLKRVA